VVISWLLVWTIICKVKARRLRIKPPEGGCAPG
jgi:hypothetical protein